MVFSLSYRSLQIPPDPMGDLEDILSRSQSNNPGLGITGVLCFDGKYFLQTIEGEAKRVGDLFLRISEDDRHGEIVPFCVGEKSARDFPGFAMMGVRPEGTRSVVPDLEEFDFSARRLSEIHSALSARALS